MEPPAQTYGSELTCWVIETCIIVPGGFTNSTIHFTTSSALEDKDVVKHYLDDGPIKGMTNR
jgi:hypothetical protein